MFEKILVANRGEIACRVMQTAHRLGYATVAVYSEADAASPHVAMADEAVCIGPPPAAQSYLSIPALIDAARRTGADAVHPGYGFLSERADFADACAAAGLVFIGPPPDAIRAMGDKARAKRRMIEAGVPCVPGWMGDAPSDEQLAAAAERIGRPLLVKAVAGGGGRGMRLVRAGDDLAEALAGARREAESAFGDGTLMLERLIEHGRHIEIQVFADRHGHALHLGERDCTAQRRRQKVIEEAPSPIVDPAMRAAMGRDAVAAARAVGYVGAGTVEFIVDADRRHWFLEMNTRLQVEHPVTECITGLDLVEWQLRVARGEPLPLTQEQVRLDGHAIEVRLYAEDPYDGWAPQTGRVERWEPGRAAVRVDHGLDAGQSVTPWYDAMVAKFVAHGHDRDDARRRLTRALGQVPLFGIAHNGRFLRDLLQHPQFVQAQMSTTRLDEWAAAGDPLLARPAPPDEAWALAAALRAAASPPGGRDRHRPASVARFELALACQGQRRTLVAPPDGLAIESWRDGEVRWSHHGVRRRHLAHDDGERLHLLWDAAVFVFAEPSPYPAAERTSDPSHARSPVAGTVVRLAVSEGDAVAAGQPLACVEAMKMEMWLHAAAAGTVRAVKVALRDAVAAGDVLVELEIES